MVERKNSLDIETATHLLVDEWSDYFRKVRALLSFSDNVSSVEDQKLFTGLVNSFDSGNITKEEFLQRFDQGKLGSVPRFLIKKELLFHPLHPRFRHGACFTVANKPGVNSLSLYSYHHLSELDGTEIFNGTKLETFVPKGFPAPFFGICFFEIEPGKATDSFESFLHLYGIQFLKALSARLVTNLSVQKNKTKGLFLREPWAICRITPNQPWTNGLPDYCHIPPTVVFQPTDNLLQYLYYDSVDNLFIRPHNRQ